ncbi:MAG: helix-turn-helix domain-containing protein [Lachnospiraceae bacterium]|nr:helix-turn-helix domain-containing protein [Lachnospiraceae bacterium]
MAAERNLFDVSVFSRDFHLESSFEEVRILVAAEGSCTLKGNGITVELGKTDYLLINIFEEADILVPEGSFAALVSLSYEELLSFAGNKIVKFRLCSLDGSGGIYTEIRFQLLGLVMCFMDDPEKERLKATGLYYLILQSLMEHFRIEAGTEDGSETREELVSRLLQYVLTNYRNELSVTEIARRFYLSRTQTSRLIRQYTGENFPDFVRRLRLKAVRKELEQTEYSVTEIALDCGFSSLSVLNRTFKEVYQMTPTEYRHAFREGGKKEEKDSSREENGRKELLKLLQEELAAGNIANDRTERILISPEHTVSRKEWKDRMLNVGTFTSLLPARMQQQVLFLKERLKIDYVRLWNPFFSPGVMLFGPRIRDYNFTVVDEILDFLVDNQLKVYLDFTPRRERNMASEQKEISGTPSKALFRSLGDWLHLIEAFCFHVRERYRAETVKQWIFECSFFLNDTPYYTEKYKPRELWNRTAGLIKTMIPGIRVAGPGVVGETEPGNNERHVREFLQNCETPPDIFTSIHFPYHGKRENIYSGIGYIRNPQRYYFLQETEQIRRSLDQCGFRGEYWVTEHGISIANRNYMQDSLYRGIQILEDMLSTGNRVDNIGIFYASDLISASADSGNVLLGSGGILSRTGLRKPVYYTYRFLNQLGSRLIKSAEGLEATCASASDIRILIWNKKNPGPKYFISEENSFRPEEIYGLFENLDPRKLEITVSGLTEGASFRIRQRFLNREHGSILEKWLRLGGSRQISRDDIEYLSQTSAPEVTIEERTAENGELKLNMELGPNEMRMIQITVIS